MFDKPKIRDPNEFKDHLIYARYVSSYNDYFRSKLEQFLIQQKVPVALKTHFNLHHKDFEDYTVGMTVVGSDGRKEKGAISKYELALISNAPSALLKSNPIAEDIIHLQNHFRMQIGGLLGSEDQTPLISLNALKYLQEIGVFTKNIEEKSLVDGDMTRYNGSGDEWPSRVFDSVPLLVSDESPQLRNSAIALIARQSREPSSEKITKKLRKRVKEYEKVTETGRQKYQGRLLTHFSVEEGLSYYNPSAKIASFKHGPLRATQGVVETQIVTLMQNATDNLSAHALLRGMPTPTTDKLFYLEADNKLPLSKTELEDLADNYLYFLWQYHRSEYEYSVNQGKITDTDPILLNERLTDVKRIVRLFRSKIK